LHTVRNHLEFDEEPRGVAPMGSRQGAIRMPKGWNNRFVGMKYAHTFKSGTFWRVAVGLLLVGLTYLWHIDTPVMWGDEAGTAVFGKTIIQRGLPIGFDGRNLSVFDNCASVSQTLLSKKIPWAQDYMASLSILVFGHTTMGVRLLFVIIGLSSFFPLYAVLRRQSNHAALVTTLVLLSPQVLLFQRNARYYPLLILLFSLLLWTYRHRFKSQKLRLILYCTLSFLFFYTHQLAAFCSMLSFVIIGVLKDKASLKVYIPAFLLGLISWVIFYFSLKSIPGNTPDTIQLLFDHPSRWVYSFLIGLKASILDLDYINVFPLLAWGFLLALALTKRARKGVLEPLGSPICLLILINLGIQIVVNSALVGFETAHQYSLMRYMPHLVAACLIPLFLVLENLLTRSMKRPGATKAWGVPLVLAIVAFLNIFTFSYWFGPMPGRPSTFSWWPPVYAEIVEQRADPFKALIETLSGDNDHDGETILVWPPYINEILIFYVGDKYLIIPNVLENSPCEKHIIKEIGLRDYSRFRTNPKWLIFFLNPLPSIPPGYHLTKIPFFRHSPDATRPEITRHDFNDETKRPTGYIFVYKRV